MREVVGTMDTTFADLVFEKRFEVKRVKRVLKKKEEKK